MNRSDWLLLAFVAVIATFVIAIPMWVVVTPDKQIRNCTTGFNAVECRDERMWRPNKRS